MTNVVIRKIINKNRKVLGLFPARDVWENWMGENVIVACEKALNSSPEDVLFNFTETGYVLLPLLNGLPEYLDRFLNAWKPSYISWI